MIVDEPGFGLKLEEGCKELSNTGLICETWNVGWILLERCSLSLTVDGLMIFTTGKGQINLGPSFFGVSLMLMSLVERCPTT